MSRHSGATVARTFSVARSASPTSSSWLSARTAPSTCVESVRCRSRSRSSSTCSRLPSTSRVRNALSAQEWNPLSLRSRPSAYLQSIRARTASAACRSLRFWSELHHAHQRQLPRVERWLPFARLDGSEEFVVKERPHFIAHPHVDVSTRKGSLRDVHGLRRDGRQLSRGKLIWFLHRFTSWQTLPG